MHEIYSKGSKKKCSTNKIDVYSIDIVWVLDILDINDYGPEKKIIDFFLVLIDNFSEYGWTVPLKKKF